MFAILTLVGFWHGKRSDWFCRRRKNHGFHHIGYDSGSALFNMRSNHSLFKIKPFSNKKLNGAALISTILMIL